ADHGSSALASEGYRAGQRRTIRDEIAVDKIECDRGLFPADDIDSPVEVGRGSEQRADLAGNFTNHLIGGAVEFPEIVAIYQVQRGALAGADREMRVRTRLVRYEHQRAGAQVQICSAERRLVERREEIDDAECGRIEFDETLAIVRSTSVRVEGPVA